MSGLMLIEQVSITQQQVLLFGRQASIVWQMHLQNLDIYKLLQVTYQIVTCYALSWYFNVVFNSYDFKFWQIFKETCRQSRD